MGFDECAPSDIQHNPVQDVLAAVKADYQHVATMVVDVSARLAKMEAFTQCIVDQNKDALRLSEKTLSAKVQALEAEIQGVQGTLDELLPQQVQERREQNISLDRLWCAKVSVQLARVESFMQHIVDQDEDTVRWVEQNLSTRKRANEAHIKGVQVTINKTVPKEVNEQWEQNVNLHSSSDVSILSSKEVRQAIHELKDEIREDMEHKIIESRDHMTNKIEVCLELSEATRRDVDKMISRIDGMDKAQQIHNLSLIKFCLRWCKLPLAGIEELAQKLETKEEELKSRYGLWKASPFEED